MILKYFECNKCSLWRQISSKLNYELIQTNYLEPVLLKSGKQVIKAIQARFRTAMLKPVKIGLCPFLQVLTRQLLSFLKIGQSSTLRKRRSWLRIPPIHNFFHFKIIYLKRYNLNSKKIPQT